MWGLIVSGCGACTDPEEEVRQVLEAAADAAESKDTQRILVLLTDEYLDSQQRDKVQVSKLLEAHFNRAPQVTVAGRKAKITIKGSAAHASYDVVLARGNKKHMKLKDILPESLGAYRFTADLIKQDKVWRIASADYSPISPFELFR